MYLMYLTDVKEISQSEMPFFFLKFFPQNT